VEEAAGENEVCGEDRGTWQRAERGRVRKDGQKVIRIDRDTLYARQDLAELLKDSGVDVDTFIGRMKCRKVFRLLWLGADILEAIRTAPALAERDHEDRDPLAAIPGGRRRGRARKEASCDASSGKMIGRFTAEEIGLS
jgi:hypothetical protein